MRGPRRRDTAWWLRAYAGAAGAILVSLGGAGLLFPSAPGSAGSLFQVSVGALFVYAGLVQRDPVVSRRFVGGMGVLLLLGVGVAVCARLLLGAVLFDSMRGTCLIVGIASVLVARRAEPGVLLAAVSAFGAALVAPISRVVLPRQREHAASSEDRGPRRAKDCRGEEPGE